MNEAKPRCHEYSFSSEIVSHAVCLTLSPVLSLFSGCRESSDRAKILIIYETIRNWCRKFGFEYARAIKSIAAHSVIPDIWMRSLSALIEDRIS